MPLGAAKAAFLGAAGTAAGGDGFEKIGSTDAGGTTEVTFTGIDSTRYQTYMIIWKTVNTTEIMSNRLRLNGTDSGSGSIYRTNWYYATNTSDSRSYDNETWIYAGNDKTSADDQVFSQSWIAGPGQAVGKPNWQYWGSLNGGSNIRNGSAWGTAFGDSDLTDVTTEVSVNAGEDVLEFPAGTIVSCYGYVVKA